MGGAGADLGKRGVNPISMVLVRGVAARLAKRLGAAGGVARGTRASGLARCRSRVVW